MGPGLRKFRPFAKARAFARTLTLRSNSEWSAFCKSGRLPLDVPTRPQCIYRTKGWPGWGDWLGTGTIAARLKKFRRFRKARAIARNLGLKSQKEWQAYSRTDRRPLDIPGNPGQDISRPRLGRDK